MVSEIYEKYTSTQVLPENASLEWYVKYFKRYLLPHLPMNKDIKILDIGCGTGFFLYALNKLGYKNSFGIDISKEQIEYAKNVLNLSNVRCGDVSEILSENIDSVQCILLIDVLEHFDADMAVDLVKKIHSSLIDNGLFILRVPNALAPLNPLISSDISHKIAFTYKSMEQVLRLGGFNSIRHYPLPPFIHGAKSFVRYFLYKVFIHPIIKIYMLIQNGSSEGGIYTTNILTVAKK